MQGITEGAKTCDMLEWWEGGSDDDGVRELVGMRAWVVDHLKSHSNMRKGMKNMVFEKEIEKEREKENIVYGGQHIHPPHIF